MLADYDQIIKNLQLLQTHQVKNAQAKLTKMSQSGFSFIKTLQNIITNPYIGGKQNYIKLSATSFFNTTVYKQIAQLDQQQLSSIIINLLDSKQVPFIAKKQLQRAITIILDIASFQLVQKWKKFVLSNFSQTFDHQIQQIEYKAENQQQPLQQPLQKKDIMFFQYLKRCQVGNMVLSCIATSQIQDEHFHQIVKDTYQKCVKAILVIKQNPRDLYSTYQFIHNFNDLIHQFFQTWKIVFDKLTQQKSKQSFSILRHISMELKIYQIINMAYNYQTVQGIYVCFTDYAGDINPIKAQVAQFHYRLLIFAFKHKNNSMALQKFSQQFVFITKTLCLLGHNKHMIQKYQASQYLTQLFKMFTHYFKQFGKHMNQDIFKNVLQFIVFPFLQADDQQRYSFQEQFEQYNGILQDCCEKQKLGYPKTQAAKLLETIEDLISQFGQYALNRAVQSLKIKLGFIQAPQNNQLRVIQVDACFLIFAILSYCLSRIQSKSILNSMKIILCDTRITKMPPFESSRLFFCLGYNFNEFFSINQNEGIHLIDFARNYTQDVHPIGSISALDFLSNIADEYYDEQFFLHTLNRFIQMKNVCQKGNSIIFSIIVRLLNNNYLSFSQKIYHALISAVFQRISKQTSILEKQQEVKNTQGIVECLNLLQRILVKCDFGIQQQNKFNVNYNQTSVSISNQSGLSSNSNNSSSYNEKTFLAVNFGLVKQELWKIHLFYSIAQKYDIAEDVSRIIYVFLKKENSITYQGNTHYFNILDNILDIFQKSEYIGTPYFMIFNEFIMKARTNGENIQKDKGFQCLNQIFRMLITGLMFHVPDLANNRHYAQQKIAAAHHLLLLQNFLGMHGTSIKDSQVFFQITSLCLKLCPQDIQQQIQNPCLLARALNLVLLCHMHIPNNDAISILLKYHDLHIYKGYDAKVLTQCIQKQIEKQNDLVSLAEMLNILVRVLTQQLDQNSNIKGQEKDKSKKKNYSTRITIKRVDDYQKILDYIQVPFNKNIDGVLVLKQIIQTMKKKNPSFYQKVINHITSQIRSHMFTLLQRKITMKNGQKRTLIKVKGVKIGNKQLYSQNNHEWKRFHNQEQHNNDKINFSDDQSSQEIQLSKKRKLINKLNQKSDSNK